MGNRIEQLEQLLSLQPNDCFILHALGLEHSKLEKYDDAISFFEKIISLNQEYIGTYYHLGKAWEEKGEPQKAIITYEEGMKIAKQLNDKHSHDELLAAKDDATNT